MQVERADHRQAAADARYFLGAIGRSLPPDQQACVTATLLRAYRWQYIVSGVQDPRFMAVLGQMISDDQRQRIEYALAPLVDAGT